MNGSVNSGDEPNLYQSSIALNISDIGHSHTIASNGGGGCHINMQPTIFYGNTFIYCGVPIMGAPNTTVFPFGIPPANPVLI